MRMKVRSRPLARASEEAIAVAESIDFFLPRLWACATLALLELSVGNPESAWRASEEMTGPVETFGIAEPITLFFLPDAIEALSRGRPDRRGPSN